MVVQLEEAAPVDSGGLLDRRLLAKVVVIPLNLNNFEKFLKIIPLISR